LWDLALDRANGISSREIVDEVNFSAGYAELGISERLSARLGTKRCHFSASHLASAMMVSP
jgi:hypothetical protein